MNTEEKNSAPAPFILGSIESAPINSMKGERSMNKEWVLFHLSEALEELENTIKEIGGDSKYDEAELSIAINHLYHHVNTAWNSRNSTDSETEECSQSNFAKWRLFPEDVDMSC